MKFRVISLHKKREEKLREKTVLKFTPSQAAEVCEVLESDKDPYKNAVRLYKMYCRANKFLNHVLDTPKLVGKPQDCMQPRSVSTSVDNAVLSTLQSRLARLEHQLCREQSSSIAGTSREAQVATLIDLSGETSIQGTSGLAQWPTLVRCRPMRQWPPRTQGVTLGHRAE